ncbi:cyclopropane-fatty-acyl-phospholipid synthase family protein [Halothiobacillus sp.]|uniref:SAM-dependent methyltransferase n=1 Tax=Halothiobacillus sp. TaxID=1891311 RepID=UPI0026362603|nr:class I SAM-dependent methyltransferase [Halothiobacillus sp.]MDD4967564.1 class I SAM-dependent methyltransferase [Halothiobacillus sp.]
MSEFWNQKYARDDYFYGEQPNDFLRSQVFRLSPGARVLVVGDGEGRNGVWLAEQGFTVTTVDASRVGCEKSAALASDRGVSLTTLCADLLTWDWPVAAFDAVVSVFLHFSPDERKVAHARMQAALVPGGWLIIEQFHPNQLNGYNSGGPKAVEMLTTMSDLAEDFNAIDWWLLAEGTTWLDEGSGHSGLGYVSHGVGRRQ